MSVVNASLARRLSAEAAHQEGIAAVRPGKALSAFARAVILSPDIPAFRRSFAASIAQLDPLSMGRPAPSRKIRQAGILQALVIVLSHGGRSAVRAEPFASAWVLNSRPLDAALARVAAAPPEQIDKMLCARPLRLGGAAMILRSLLTGVAIKEPRLLARLEDLRESYACAIQSGGLRSLSKTAEDLLEAVAQQVWIQDGLLIRPVHQAPDFSVTTACPTAIAFARRLFSNPALGLIY